VTRALLVAVALLGACHPALPPSAPPPTGRAAVVASNVTRDDYAGSQSCKPCHAELFADWLRSPMHNMTRPVREVALRAPFAGEQFRFKRDLLTFETHDGDRFMKLDSADTGEHLYRVTKVIGGHHREDFAGVEVKPEPGLPPSTGVERVLPASFMLEGAAWRYKGYSVMTPERPALRPGAVWSKTCIFCHNTEPYFSDLMGMLAGPSTPPYQGEVVDSLLPAARRWSYVVTDEAAAQRAAAREVAFLGGRPAGGAAHDELDRAVKVTRAMFGEKNLVEVGIGCESCHGGSKEHVRAPEVRPSLVPRASFLRVEEQTRSRAAEINHACARCHQVLFTQYPWTWEGEARKGQSPGGAHINSGEARDFLLGGCSSQMSCVACHDPHAPDNRQRMAELEGPKGTEVCLRCHEKYSSAEARRAHTHHDPAGAGAACLGCHMPKKNMSLDNRLGRYHRIASPTENAKVEGDRPLECALCHADKKVGELVSTMEKWWGKTYDRDKLRALYGSLDADPLRETIRRGKPHEQAVALLLVGEAKSRADLALLASQLTNGVPIVRYYAERALEAVLGEKLGVDLFQTNEQIRAQAEARLGTRITASPSSSMPGASNSPSADPE
jgi:predicted CXXCH cytochrome family protein